VVIAVMTAVAVLLSWNQQWEVGLIACLSWLFNPLFLPPVKLFLWHRVGASESEGES